MSTDSTEGLIQLQSGMIPTNLNPKGWVTDNSFIKGAPQTFASLAALIAFHPFKMSAGMSATVINHPAIGNVSDFRLITDPALLIDANKESTITLDNYEAAWELVDIVQSTNVTVYMYAPDSSGGGAPIYPYTPSSEANAQWEPVFDANKAHRWMRFRADDIDSNGDGVFDNWTQPIRVSDSFTSGDYIENRFKRQAVDDTIHSSDATLSSGKYYGVLTGSITKDDNGVQTIFGIGSIFEYAIGAGITYTFNTATAQETVPPPPRTINGIPNNDPSAAGWQDTVPIGTDQLWQIWAQKSVYGQLKSDWRIKRVNENANFIRYNNSASDHPDKLVNINTDADVGSPGDIALIDKNWVTIYDNHVFMAQRELISTSPNLYTTWQLQKIDEESGEYTDNVFKLFDLNLDSDDPILEPPLTRNALDEGWSDTPVIEPVDGTQVNYISTVRKFFDGTLKTPWSTPVAYTGKDSWVDVIVSDTGDDFKYDNSGAVTPVQINLTAKLFKGLAKMWLSNTITYVWEIVFNNGGNGLPEGTIAGQQGSTPLFYYSLGNGVPIGDITRIQDGQIVTILPNAVDGKAIIKCTQTIEISAGNTLDFVEEFSVLDITDGNDARALAINTDTYIIAYDGGSTSLAPYTVSLRAYQSNLINQTWQWWIDKGNQGSANWVELTVATPGYSINGPVLDFVTDVVNTHWSQDAVKQENRFAITNYNGNPDTPSTDPLLEQFRDMVTITKLAGGGGQDGTSPTAVILTNEAHTIVLDTTSGIPQAGQIGASSPATTKILFYEGTNLRVYRGVPNPDEWVITSVTATALDADGTQVDADVTAGFAGIDGQSEAEVSILNWVSSNFPTAATISAQITINISYNGSAYSKIFTLGTSLDAPGAIVLDIDSDKGFVFDILDRTDKLLTANVIDDTGNYSNADFHFGWVIEGVFQGYGDLNANTRLLTNLNIRNNSDITVYITTNPATVPPVGVFRRRSVRFSDALDGKIYIFWNNELTKPVAPIGNGRDNTQLGNWYRQDDVYWDTNTPKWASDGQEIVSDGTFTWSQVYQIGQEAGVQGENGGFEMSMYKKDSLTLPALPMTIGSMKLEGWSAIVPTPTSGSTIYVVRRFYKGDYLGITVQFDASNEPIWGTEQDDNDGTNAAKVLGDWSIPASLIVTPVTPTDGVDGIGIDGWTPSFAVVADGSTREVLQLIDWVGGTGIKPNFIGQYVSSTGFTPNIATASNIKGATGAAGSSFYTRDITGLISSSGFKVAGGGSYTGWTSSRQAIGQYVLTHNNSTNNYVVLASVHATTTVTDLTVALYQKNTNSIWFRVTNSAGTFVDADIHFHCLRW